MRLKNIIENPSVTIILTTWNNWSDTAECLLSIFENNYKNFSVVVIDNKSTDQTVPMLQKHYPNVRIFINSESESYTKSINEGFRVSLERKSKYSLLLNNDTKVDPNFLVELVKRAESNSKIGIVASKMYFYDDPKKIWYIGGKVDLSRGIVEHPEYGMSDTGNHEAAKETEYCTGCSTLYRNSMLLEIGLADEKFEMYMSDVEHSVRARTLGYKIFFEPKSVIWHKVSRSRQKSDPYKEFMKSKESVRFFRAYSLQTAIRYSFRRFFSSMNFIPSNGILFWIQVVRGIISGFDLNLKKISEKFTSDRLLSNSIYLMAGTGVMSVTGFIFWIVNTKFHSPEQIGVATTFISIVTLITSFSMVGLNITLVRYLPTSNKKNELINTVFSLILLSSFVLSAIFLLGIDHFSPPLRLLLLHPLPIFLFLLFVPIASLNMITDSVFISHGKAIYTLIVNTVLSLAKLILTIALVSLGAYGIIFSFGIATLIATLLSVLILIHYTKYVVHLRPHIDQIINIWKFSFGNYVSSLLSSIASLLTPILITSKLSPEVTAYYYMPTMIVNLLLTIPRSTVASLIAEGSREEQPLLKLALRSLLHVYVLLLPACLAILIFGNLILSAFGKNYSSEGLLYLKMIVFAIILSAPSFISGAVINIRKQLRLQFTLNLISAVSSIGLNIFFLSGGLFGLGVAAIVYQVFISCVYFMAILVGDKNILRRVIQHVR
jgi:GT2 family glycosyltransferase/O-antigen/teichoic acid export membrane protein